MHHQDLMHVPLAASNAQVFCCRGAARQLCQCQDLVPLRRRSGRVAGWSTHSRSMPQSRRQLQDAGICDPGHIQTRERGNLGVPVCPIALAVLPCLPDMEGLVLCGMHVRLCQLLRIEDCSCTLLQVTGTAADCALLRTMYGSGASRLTAETCP